MRGAPSAQTRPVRERGIIPADAGSTCTGRPGRCSGPSARDHPRGCGEHEGGALPFGKVKGSSPRMRGARLKVVISVNRRRIIPADAGSTDSGCQVVFDDWDHPRGCGEHGGLS